MTTFSYNLGLSSNSQGVSKALNEIFGGKSPVICCIGTDAVSGDSLGPVVGTMLNRKLLGKTYIYGTLEHPITAKDVYYANRFISFVHPKVPVLAIDAGLGKREEVGTIKIAGVPIKPGLGVDKNLCEMGEASIIAVVEEKAKKNLLSSVRLSSVYLLAKEISDGILEYFEKYVEEKNYGVKIAKQ